MSLAEADYDMTEQAFSGSNRGDEHLYVRFFIHAHPNQEKTKEAGRPIFDDREYVEIIQPGNKENIVSRPVRDSDRQRFPKQYAAFKNKEQDQTSGTPLAQWPLMTPSMVEELKHLRIVTVEQLANLSDSAAGKFMGMQTWKQKAKAFLEASGISAEGEKIFTEMNTLRAENDTLKDQMAKLTKQLEKLEKGASK